RQFVRVELNLVQSDPGGESVEHHPLAATACIPDGNTVVLNGWKKDSVVLTGCGVPVLSNLPYMGRLFTTVGYLHKSQRVFVLVTPRVIKEPEEESGFKLQPAGASQR